MTPLEPVSARLFPTLARYARRQWWLGLTGLVAVLCALSFAGGVVIGSYRGKVADENYHTVVMRQNILEQQYQEDHPKTLRTTKMQAAVIVAKKEKEREP